MYSCFTYTNHWERSEKSHLKLMIILNCMEKNLGKLIMEKSVLFVMFELMNMVFAPVDLAEINFSNYWQNHYH